MKKTVKLNRETGIKVVIFIILPTLIALALYFIYRYYLMDSRIINKVILQKDMEFKYFTYSEFDSPAGATDIANGVETYSKKGKKYITDSGKDFMSPVTISKLDRARDLIEREWNAFNPLSKIYFVINSGYRSVSRNAEVGGVENSAHVKGYAADVAWHKYSQEQKDKIREVLERVGFNRLGIANSFIHVDDDLSKPQNAVWTY